MQRAGLQWLYQLGQDPRSLLRRFLILNIQFMVEYMPLFLSLRAADPSKASRPSTEMYYV
jgi:hypothetical protein